MPVIVDRATHVRRLHVRGGVPTMATLHTTVLPGDRVVDGDTDQVYTVSADRVLVAGDPAGNIDASGIVSGTIATARLGSGVADGTKVLKGDQSWGTVAGGTPDPHATSHHSGGADALDLASVAGTITAGQHGTPAGDLHPTYALDADLAAHEAAADPHGVYQKESEKGAASGYASLDGATKVPIAEIPTGASATTVCIGNDARLSDARTPTAHATAHQNNGSDEISVAGLSGVLADPQPPIIGAGATQAVAGNDARLTDARTPTAHATSHKSGGGDAIRLDEFAAPTASVGFNAQQATSFRVENRTSDPITPAAGTIWLRTDL